ncbi:hypothetical protein ACQP2X_32780 [Actinoplanes sp. CA-131856]
MVGSAEAAVSGWVLSASAGEGDIGEDVDGAACAKGVEAGTGGEAGVEGGEAGPEGFEVGAAGEARPEGVEAGVGADVGGEAGAGADASDWSDGGDETVGGAGEGFVLDGDAAFAPEGDGLAGAVEPLVATGAGLAAVIG